MEMINQPVEGIKEKEDQRRKEKKEKRERYEFNNWRSLVIEWYSSTGRSKTTNMSSDRLVSIIYWFPFVTGMESLKNAFMDFINRFVQILRRVVDRVVQSEKREKRSAEREKKEGGKDDEVKDEEKEEEKKEEVVKEEEKKEEKVRISW